MDPNFSFEYKFRDSDKPNEISPIIIMLHGYGSNENDLFSFASHIPENYKIISLRAPYPIAYGGYSWYDFGMDDKMNFQINLKQAKDSMLKIKDFVSNKLDKICLFDINKICLIGFSQGTILSYALSLNNPKLFSKTIALSGKINLDLIDKKNNDFSNLNFFCSHGIQDQVIPVDLCRESIDWLKINNIDHIYKEYDMAHNVNQENFYDLLNWINTNVK